MYNSSVEKEIENIDHQLLKWNEFKTLYDTVQLSEGKMLSGENLDKLDDIDNWMATMTDTMKEINLSFK